MGNESANKEARARAAALVVIKKTSSANSSKQPVVKNENPLPLRSASHLLSLIFSWKPAEAKEWDKDMSHIDPTIETEDHLSKMPTYVDTFSNAYEYQAYHGRLLLKEWKAALANSISTALRKILSFAFS